MTDLVPDYRPRGGRGERKNAAQMDAEAVKAFEMRAAGASTWDIARELNISVQTACKRIDRARAVMVPAAIETAREMSMRSLEVAQQKLLQDWARLQTSADQANKPGMGKIEHSPKFAEALVKIQDRMSKLNGWDKPILIEQTVTHIDADGIDAEVKRLAEQLGLGDLPTEESRGAESEPAP